jgi:hypothetical protein
LKKWVSKGVLPPIVELNADGLSEEDLQSLKRLNSIEESEYAIKFYDFDNYLNKFQTYTCEVNACGKMYFDHSKYLFIITIFRTLQNSSDSKAWYNRQRWRRCETYIATL